MLLQVVAVCLFVAVEIAVTVMEIVGMTQEVSWLYKQRLLSSRSRPVGFAAELPSDNPTAHRC